MADDDEAVFRAQKAAGKARGMLSQARRTVGSAGAPFNGTMGLLSWRTLDDKLNKRKACAARYKELQYALRDAEAAISRAEAACDALRRATQR
ncbi:hypothetical protein GCM10009609_29790 [Pseudonocardia aurantiaca]|uniref:Uncharacterized protein n=1 Tax=Pseudonocardia aurantiaca TaxID=75290 RepID=A0ABW4FJB1_9PSEU